jgi:hypothetical protein
VDSQRKFKNACLNVENLEKSINTGMYNFLRGRTIGYISVTRFPNLVYEYRMHRINVGIN